MTNYLSVAENRPIGIFENRPFEQLALSHGRGKKIGYKELEELAINIYEKNGSGIIYKDVMKKFFCSREQAQRKLKNACIETVDNKGKKTPILFRAFKRTSPQQFYPYSKRATIVENWKNNKNRLINPTGVSLYQSPYLEHIKARYVSELLTLLDNQPLSIHKVHLKLFIDKTYYEEINVKKITEGNKSKVHEEKIGLRNVNYQAYPDGTVMIYIKCSNNPFKLAVEEDISSFFSFLGQVKDRFVHFLSDFSESAIPPIMDWILVQYDLNQDIDINIVEQLSIPDLQLRIHDRIFRLYVKSINGNSCYRKEESKQVNQEIRFAIPEIMNISQTTNHNYYDYGKFQYIQ